MQRTIDAPDKEWLNATEVAEWLNIKDTAFALLLKEEVIPSGRKLTRSEEYWHWRTVLAISILLETGYFARKEGVRPPPPTPREQKSR